jgi:hypothetical protein
MFNLKDVKFILLIFILINFIAIISNIIDNNLHTAFNDVIDSFWFIIIYFMISNIKDNSYVKKESS